MEKKPEIILVHGLWFGSWAMARLARKLQADGVSGSWYGGFLTKSATTGDGRSAGARSGTPGICPASQSDQLHFVKP